VDAAVVSQVVEDRGLKGAPPTLPDGAGRRRVGQQSTALPD
jgi:hypothetical protein